jgi:hypothetical protein
MEKMILTDGGNLLRHCELGWYFQKPNGEFLREVSENEATFLAKNGHEIDFHFPNFTEKFSVWFLEVPTQFAMTEKIPSIS